jgi:hypothetical protein
MSTEIFDPSQRRLCPDGACVGLLNSNGRCGVCGQVGGPTQTNGASTNPVGLDAAEPAVVSTPSFGGFDPNRRLCADGACVGVIAANNRCSICGMEAA